MQLANVQIGKNMNRQRVTNQRWETKSKEVMKEKQEATGKGLEI